MLHGPIHGVEEVFSQSRRWFVRRFFRLGPVISPAFRGSWNLRLNLATMMSLFIYQDKVFQHFAFGVEPIVQSHVLVTASPAPKFVRAFLDFLLHPEVVTHRENWGGVPFELHHAPASLWGYPKPIC